MDGTAFALDLDTDDVAALRRRIWEAGYKPVPVYNIDHPVKSPGKQPMGEGWTDAARQASPPCTVMPPHECALNTGILCDGLRAVDIDVDDDALADRLHNLAVAMLGMTPTRSRANARRVLLVYRAAEGEPGKRYVRGANHTQERSCKIEVLGHGQQFVAFGLHPSGVTLEWTPSPLDLIPRAELPTITETTLDAFLSAAGAMIGAKPDVAAERTAQPIEAAHTSSRLGPAADPLDIAAALAVIPNTTRDWDQWSRIGLATWAASGGSPEGFSAWSAWSARCAADGVHDHEMCRRAWRGFAMTPPDDIGAGTLFHLARAGRDDWKKPSEDGERAAPRSPAEPLRAITAAALLATDLPPRELILAPWLPAKGLAMVYGPRGIGKTHLTLGAAYAIASGGPFLRWKAEMPRRVLVIDGEMPAVVLQERLALIARSAEAEPPTPGHLRLIALDMQERGLNLADVADHLALEPLVDAADIIVVDNISTLARGGKENEAESWLPVQSWALDQRRAGKSVVFVHHAGKGGQQRGTSRREDVLDTVIALRRPEDHEADQGARFQIHFEKNRGFYGEEAMPFEAALGPAGWTTTDLADADMARVVALAEEGMSVREIADETGIPKSRVQRMQTKAREAGKLFTSPPSHRAKRGGGAGDE